MAERIRIDHGTVEAGKRILEQEWKIPQSVKREVLNFLDDLALGKVNRGKKISQRRQLKYLHGLRAPLEFFNKPTGGLRLRDIEQFEKALGAGSIRTRLNPRSFAHSTQVDMRILLRIFLRWRLGPVKASQLAGWLDTRPQSKTPDFLKEAEAEMLYRNCRNAKQRFLLAVLFDTGARAEEFHNIRYEDIQLPEGSENFVRITIKEEYSKTLGRTVALYWKFSLEAVREYLAQRIAEGIKPQDPVFRGTYDANKQFLRRLGWRVLKRRVHFHLFRHTSATYYATRLNRQELCYRLGLRFGTDTVDIYISRSGMETRGLDEKFTQTELSAVNEKLAGLEQENMIKNERIRQLEEETKAKDIGSRQLKDSMKMLAQNLGAVWEVLLKLNPTLAEVEAAALRKKLLDPKTALASASGSNSAQSEVTGSGDGSEERIGWTYSDS